MKSIIGIFKIIFLMTVACIAIGIGSVTAANTVATCEAAQIVLDNPRMKRAKLSSVQRDVLTEVLCSTQPEDASPEPNSDDLIVEPIRVFVGEKAVAEVAKREGYLTDEMKHVVREEGYVLGLYHDTGETYASGVGQTGKFIGMTFKETFHRKRYEASAMFPELEAYSEQLRSNIISSVYRGGLSGSPKTRSLIRQGRFKEASVEFLRNSEYYRAKESGSGVAGRMERLSNALLNEHRLRNNE